VHPIFFDFCFVAGLRRIVFAIGHSLDAAARGCITVSTAAFGAERRCFVFLFPRHGTRC